MTTAIATFHSDSLDGMGIPTRFHRYLVIETPFNDTYRAISITPLTDGTPRYKSAPIMTKEKTPEKAIKYAFEELQKHSDLRGLKSDLSINPSK